MRSYRFLLFISLVVMPGLAQSPSHGAPAALTVDSVIAMVSAGLPEDVIIARLKQDAKPFNLSSDDLIRLKKAAVPNNVMKVMMDPMAEVVPSNTPAEPPAAPAAPVTPAAAPAVPAMPAPQASGATPAPGAAAPGDPNDPMAAHDSGIYFYGKDRDGKPLMTVLERAAYQGSKTGGILSMTLTYGIKKAKTKAVIPGPHAGIRVEDSPATFFFYFDDKQAGLGKTYFGINSLTNPNQFALLKLEVNKGNRETVVGEYGVFGSSTGTDSKAMIPFKSERIRPGLYKVTISDLKLGEYCFLASAGNLGVVAAGAAGAADIFDFGVTAEGR
jgi:hypothetical protein